MRSAPDGLSTLYQDALVRLGAVMSEARDPWCLIGGAAALLHGADIPRLHDMDVLVSRRDGRAIVARLGLVPDNKAVSDRFRSTCFCTWTSAGIPVEFMADFSVFANGTWLAVRPEPAEIIRIGDAELLLPSLDGLIAMHRLFGRDKDRARIADLEALAQREAGTSRAI